jgi:hypothetical protein
MNHSMLAHVAELFVLLTLVLCPNGTVLRNPDEAQLASCLGLIPELKRLCINGH